MSLGAFELGMRERCEQVVQESFPTVTPAVAAGPPVTAIARPDDDDVLTVDELVAWLRLSESTVLKLLSERAIPARKVGHQWRIRRGKVRAWLDGGE